MYRKAKLSLLDEIHLLYMYIKYSLEINVVRCFITAYRILTP